jgi:hypothetical protein
MNENTLAALQQVIGEMVEDPSNFLTDASREERRAFGELFQACEEFIRLASDLEEQEGLLTLASR